MRIDTIVARRHPGAMAGLIARRVVLHAASRIRRGRLTVILPDGRRHTFGDAASRGATLRAHDDEFFVRLLLHGEIGLGEAYTDGLWSTDDLVALAALGLANRDRLNLDLPVVGWAARLRDLRLHRARRNTVIGSRRNIHAHYDLTNGFYRLFLDPSMTYSCALFGSSGENLEDAQRNKYRRACERGGINPGDRVLEIGCGWGGFATFAAREYGCRVTAITISGEQLAYARRLVDAEGLSSQVDVQLCDYRRIAGRFDRIVSIEMLEAVGHEYLPGFFRSCDRVLRPGGTLFLQVITVPARAHARQREGVNWIQKHIFPGGVLPSLAALESAMAPTSLAITGVEDIGQHYASTLREWRRRYMAQLPEVRALGFDERFIRTWEYYLAVCEASFLQRNTFDLQIVCERLLADATSQLPAEALD